MPDNESSNSAQTTPDGAVKNTGAQTDGETPSSKSQGEATQADAKAFTQADLDKLAQRIRAEEKRKFEKELKDAALSETERANKRVLELEKEIRQRDARLTVVEAARKAGASNPEAVYALSRAMLEWDDKSGELANLRDAVEYARETAPELFPKRPGSGNGGEGSAGSFSRNMNDEIRRQAGRR